MVANRPDNTDLGPEAPLPIPPLLTAREVMAILKVGRTTLYQLTKSGQIRSLKVGGEVRYRQADLESYINAALRGQSGAGNV